MEQHHLCDAFCMVSNQSEFSVTGLGFRRFLIKGAFSCKVRVHSELQRLLFVQLLE